MEGWLMLAVGLALGTILGRTWEKWLSGLIDVEEAAYKAGYEAGKQDGAERIAAAPTKQPPPIRPKPEQQGRIIEDREETGDGASYHQEKVKQQ